MFNNNVKRGAKTVVFIDKYFPALSNLIRRALEEIVEKDQGYDLAMKRDLDVFIKVENNESHSVFS